MNTFVALIKREFWEQKHIIIWPPAVVAFIGTGLTISLLISFVSNGTLTVNGSLQGIELAADQRVAFASATVLVTSGVFLGICGLTALYYLAGALYNDRKDRSILFWKSLPTTELQTIFSKLVTGMLVFPAFAIAFTAATVVIGYGVLSIATLFLDDHIISAIVSSVGLSFSGLMDGIGILCAITFHMAILSIPLFCYLLFISAVSRRSPIFFAMIPFIVISITAPIWGKLISGDHWLIMFFADYFALAPNALMSFDDHIKTSFGHTILEYNDLASLGSTLSAIEFWIMMAISGGLLWAATILRKSSSELS